MRMEMTKKMKEQELWETCSEGNLELVKKILSPSGACHEVVSLLLHHPDIDVVKLASIGVSSFLMVCQESHKEVFRVLLTDERIDVCLSDCIKITPFARACQVSDKEIISMLMIDPRIHINQEDQVWVHPPFCLLCVEVTSLRSSSFFLKVIVLMLTDQISMEPLGSLMHARMEGKKSLSCSWLVRGSKLTN
jgi:hypothetical protein